MFISKFFKLIDFYSGGPTLLLQNKKRLNSELGGLISIAIAAVVGFLSWTLGNDILYKVNPYLLVQQEFLPDDSFQPFNYKELFFAFTFFNAATGYVLDQNKIYDVELSHAIYVQEGDKTAFYSWDLGISPCEKYENQTGGYFDYQGLYLNETILKCIENTTNLRIGGTPAALRTDWLLVRVRLCQNTTEKIEKGEYCYPREEALNKVSRNFITFFFTDKRVVPKNFEEPIQPYMKDIYQYIDSEIYKDIEFRFRGLQIKTDKGWFLEELVEEESFQYEYLRADVLSSQPEEDVFSDIWIFQNRNLTVYERRYLKIQELLASLGGILKFVVVCFTLLITPINIKQINIELMSEIYDFSNEETHKKHKTMENILHNFKTLLQFRSKLKSPMKPKQHNDSFDNNNKYAKSGVTLYNHTIPEENDDDHSNIIEGDKIMMRNYKRHETLNKNACSKSNSPHQTTKNIESQGKTNNLNIKTQIPSLDLEKITGSKNIKYYQNLHEKSQGLRQKNINDYYNKNFTLGRENTNFLGIQDNAPPKSSRDTGRRPSLDEENIVQKLPSDFSLESINKERLCEPISEKDKHITFNNSTKYLNNSKNNLEVLNNYQPIESLNQNYDNITSKGSRNRYSDDYMSDRHIVEVKNPKHQTTASLEANLNIDCSELQAERKKYESFNYYHQNLDLQEERKASRKYIGKRTSDKLAMEKLQGLKRLNTHFLNRIKNVNEIVNNKNYSSRLNFSIYELFISVCCIQRLKSNKIRYLEAQYDKCLDDIKEYLNFNSLIKRIQEIDQLKLVLLNPEQYMCFNFLAKPEIYTNKKKAIRKSTMIVEKEKNLGNEEKLKIIVEYFAMLEQLDPETLDFKLLEIMDENIRDLIFNFLTYNKMG